MKDKANKVAERYIDVHKQNIARISYTEGYETALNDVAAWLKLKTDFKKIDELLKDLIK